MYIGLHVYVYVYIYIYICVFERCRAHGALAATCTGCRPYPKRRKKTYIYIDLYAYE